MKGKNVRILTRVALNRGGLAICKKNVPRRPEIEMAKQSSDNFPSKLRPNTVQERKDASRATRLLGIV
jgi:hypothetical protein